MNIELKVRRADLVVPDNLLQRTYEALKRPRHPASQEERWNPHGRKYGIKGLHNLTKTPNIRVIEFENGIEGDLKQYEREHRKRR